MKDLPFLSILPRHDKDKGIYWIACSGGIDSMYAAFYLSQARKRIGLVYFNHGTEYADEAEHFVARYAQKIGAGFLRDKVKGECPAGRSKEDWWREQRYSFINSINGPVITGHHLDDAIETWLWSACHGTPKLPELVNKNVYRPFLCCKKAAMKEKLVRCGRDNTWIEDPSNADTSYTRNYIRQNITPHLYKVNPGIDTVIQKKLFERATFEKLKLSS